MNDKTTTECDKKIGEQLDRTYVQIFLYRVPKKNNGAIAKKNLRRFIPWFNERRGTAEYYQQLDKSEFHGLVTQGKGLVTGGFSP